MIFRVEAFWSTRGVVFARQTMPGNFEVTVNSTLGGYAISSFEAPRKLDVYGRQESALFGFVLARPSDIIHFSRGQEVELT